jgi:hypothetical protein
VRHLAFASRTPPRFAWPVSPGPPVRTLGWPSARSGLGHVSMSHSATSPRSIRVRARRSGPTRIVRPRLTQALSVAFTVVLVREARLFLVLLPSLWSSEGKLRAGLTSFLQPSSPKLDRIVDGTGYQRSCPVYSPQSCTFMLCTGFLPLRDAGQRAPYCLSLKQRRSAVPRSACCTLVSDLHNFWSRCLGLFRQFSYIYLHCIKLAQGKVSPARATAREGEELLDYEALVPKDNRTYTKAIHQATVVFRK